MSVLHSALSPLTRGVPDPQRGLLRAAGLGVALALAAGVALVGFDAGLGLTVTGYRAGRRAGAGADAARLSAFHAGPVQPRDAWRGLRWPRHCWPPLAGGAAPWAVFAVAALALALDGIDGWLARREGLTSGFGARFDMEVDSALALILALNAWAAGTAGAIVLLIGLPRYAFAAAALAFPWLDRPRPSGSAARRSA